MAISVDEIEATAKTQASYEVPFPLLSDPDLRAHEAYRVVNTLDQAGVEKLKKLGLDVERWSQRQHHKIGIPAMFVVGRDGVIRFAHAAHDYTTRPRVEDLIARLRAERADAGAH